MAVYNVELYLREAIESVVQQDIGFENIQLILVNDGSKDGSGAICDEYAAKYPNNILAIHKENGGVATSRNEGLKHVQGEFVNFLDADDKLSLNTVREVCDFFAEHYEETDVVAFPMKFFDGQLGGHPLNYKFNAGNRVIDLDSEWDNPQLSMSSAFVKAASIRPLCFDSRLSYAEDNQVMQKILLSKHSLGVINGATYWYRRRTAGQGSAVQASTTRKEWYLPYMHFFQQHIIEYYYSRIHTIPRFIQFTLMYDLQWRFQQKSIPDGVLTDEEKAEFFELLFNVLQYIEDDVIYAQRNISRAYKLLVLETKYRALPNRSILDNDLGFIFTENTKFMVSESPFKLEFIHLEKTNCIIDGVVSILPFFAEHIEVVAKLGDQLYKSSQSTTRQITIALDREIQKQQTFHIQFPLYPNENCDIEFLCNVDGVLIPMTVIDHGSFFPVSTTFINSHYTKNGWIIQPNANGLRINSYSRKLQCKLTLGLYKELWPEDRKAVFVRICVNILKKLKNKPIWLISDRVMKAGDNGEAFFRYMRLHHSEIDSYYVISENSPDFETLKQVGPVIKNESYKHKLYHFLSEYVISSSAELGVYNPFYEHPELYRELITDTKFIFLQHGVIKDDLSAWAGRFNKNIAGFVTSAKPEFISVAFGAYEYEESQVWLTGLPRFDRLYRDEQKWITIMPTWRKYLLSRFDRENDIWLLKPDVESSEYVQFFSSLLNDPKLLNAAKKYGYRIKFLPHPNFQTHLDLFKPNNDVDFLGLETQYRDIYAKSNLVITDYSSAVFDFAYLRKPVLYTQFDAEHFFAGDHSYAKGYFDYERDGFGEVEYTLEGTVDRIIEYMENGCKLKDKYLQRIDNFFAFDDQNNCERVYQKIIELGKNKGV